MSDCKQIVIGMVPSCDAPSIIGNTLFAFVQQQQHALNLPSVCLPHLWNTTTVQAANCSAVSSHPKGHLQFFHL